MKWKPRETAPKDGNDFIAWDPTFGLLFTMHWKDDQFLTQHEMWSGTFTHWMPLPGPPQ